MIKLPVNLARWNKMGERRNLRTKIFLVTGLFFIFATFTHSLDFAKKMRDQRIEELKNEVTSLARDEKSREQMLKVFGLSESPSSSGSNNKL
jgi:hypothetical protein